MDRETVRQGDGATERIRTHRDLMVWQNAMDAAMGVFEASKRFPIEERYSITDQMRRSSRSVAANIAEAWRKRRYAAAFIAKLNDAESEACETQTWIELARRCGYLDAESVQKLDELYERILGQLVVMANQSEHWTISPQGGKH
jgi:four helix bundle protein